MGTCGKAVGMYPNREHSWEWVKKEYDFPILVSLVRTMHKLVKKWSRPSMHPIQEDSYSPLISPINHKNMYTAQNMHALIYIYQSSNIAQLFMI